MNENFDQASRLLKQYFWTSERPLPRLMAFLAERELLDLEQESLWVNNGGSSAVAISMMQQEGGLTLFDRIKAFCPQVSKLHPLGKILQASQERRLPFTWRFDFSCDFQYTGGHLYDDDRLVLINL
ncbi:hypothetical protein CL619_01725 [archaeon]|nr:hypothetical protein [archaeon]